MSNSESNSTRLKINQYDEWLEVIIGARKSYFVNLFLGLWMFGWIYGEVTIIENGITYPNQPIDAFQVFWFLGWNLGGIFALFIGLWNNRGREIIKVDQDNLKHTREYVLFSRSKNFESSTIINLRLFQLNPSMSNMSEGMEFWGLSGGSIAFDSGETVYKFGLGLEENEALSVIREIKNYYPHLGKY